MALTEDEGFGGFPLRVQRVELLLQALIGRLPGVNGAADGFWIGNARLHGGPFRRLRLYRVLQSRRKAVHSSEFPSRRGPLRSRSCTAAHHTYSRRPVQ